MKMVVGKRKCAVGDNVCRLEKRQEDGRTHGLSRQCHRDSTSFNPRPLSVDAIDMVQLTSFHKRRVASEPASTDKGLEQRHVAGAGAASKTASSGLT